MLVKWLSTKLRVEAAGGNILRINIHTYSKRVLLSKPDSYFHQQSASYSLTALCFGNIDPLQFTLTSIPACAVSRNKSHQCTVFHCNQCSAGGQGLLRRMLPS